MNRKNLYSPCFVEKFWQAVDKDGPIPIHAPHLGNCWIWKKGKCGGYGAINQKFGKQLRAHRVSWEIANGPIPEGLFALHKCDNHSCVRSEHIFVGTQKENMADCAKKGRTCRGNKNGTRTHPEKMKRGEFHHNHLHPERMARGSAHGNAKLSEEKVVQIRSLFLSGTTQQSLSKQFGVSRRLIYMVLNKSIWKHV